MPRTVRVRRRLPDGSLSEERDEEVATSVEFYEGDYHGAIVDALNVLGCWHSPLTHLTPESDEWLALLGEDYEWCEAMDILYGALGIEFDPASPRTAWERFAKLRDVLWNE